MGYDKKSHKLPLTTFHSQIDTGIGLIAPFDFALDAECWRWMPKDNPLYITRTPYVENSAVTVTLAKEVSDDTAVKVAAKSLFAVKPASIAYACTSGSFVDGKEGELRLREIMKDGGTQHTITTSGALVMALQHLKIKTLAIATPYNESLTELLAAFLHEYGFNVTSSGYLDKEEGISQLNYDSVRKLVYAVNTSEAEAVFLSCTNLRTFDVIAELENELNKPVLSANQITIWAALKQASIPLPKINQRLFTS